MLKLCVAFLIFGTVFCTDRDNKLDCELSPELANEILSYAPVANAITSAIVSGEFKGSTYKILADFGDQFGPRLTGSQALETSIDYILERSIELNLDNVHGEDVEVPHWVRGQESATLISPWQKPLRMLSLGSSVGTPPEGIEAEVVVVKSFDELDQIPQEQIAGKIVVYAQDWVSYGETGQYRYEGASRASEKGAIASLIRSITPFSLDTPHTGMQRYTPGVTEIPTACITVEDAFMMYRMYTNGQPIVIHLQMEAQNLPAAISRNLVAEISGTQAPEKVVLISGHIDSWDVGQGVMDDAGGSLLSWNSMAILKQLGLIPKRTVRTVLWTAEEVGLIGADAYYNEHLDEIDNFNFIMESDFGTFNPLGLNVKGNDEAACIVQKVLNLLEPLNTTSLVRRPSVGSDISVFNGHGIPAADLLSESENYFWYHHTEADSMTMEDSDTLDKVTALWATVTYVIADLSIDMPKGEQISSDLK